MPIRPYLETGLFPEDPLMQALKAEAKRLQAFIEANPQQVNSITVWNNGESGLEAVRVMLTNVPTEISEIKHAALDLNIRSGLFTLHEFNQRLVKCGRRAHISHLYLSPQAPIDHLDLAWRALLETGKQIAKQDFGSAKVRPLRQCLDSHSGIGYPKFTRLIWPTLSDISFQQGYKLVDTMPGKYCADAGEWFAISKSTFYSRQPYRVYLIASTERTPVPLTISYRQNEWLIASDQQRVEYDIIADSIVSSLDLSTSEGLLTSSEDGEDTRVFSVKDSLVKRIDPFITPAFPPFTPV